MLRLRAYTHYLRDRYGTPAYRVPVDAGLGCPHRKGDPPEGGCIYCSPARARAPWLKAGQTLAAQVDAGIRRLASRPAGALLLYVQASTGTNAPSARLRRLYDEALERAAFRELIVATRPDCLDRERVELLASYLRPEFDVWVELGLQSANDQTLERIRRGHTVADFRAAYQMLRERGLKVAVHLVFGLPGESEADIMETARYVGSLRPDGVKIHNLHVCRGTALEQIYLRGELSAPGPAAHLRYVSRALELFPEQTIIIRLTTDTPASELLAPRGFCDKPTFRRLLEEAMVREGRRQGGRFLAEAREQDSGAIRP